MTDEDPANEQTKLKKRNAWYRQAMRGDKDEKAMRDDDDEDDKKRKKEELDLEVIDDEALTEAVLQRVVERLLRRK